MAARRYIVQPGHSFDLGNGKSAGAGEVVELAEDVAAVHAHRIAPEEVQTPAPDADEQET